MLSKKPSTTIEDTDLSKQPASDIETVDEDGDS